MNNKRRLGICVVLTIVFALLKFLGFITWPWVWVVSPIWLPITFGLCILAAIMVFVIIQNLFDRL